MPKTRPSGLVMPSMASTRAVGVVALVHGGLRRPDQRTGWRPARSSISSSSTFCGGHEAALAVADGHGVLVAHGAAWTATGCLVEAMRVRTSMLWWRPMVLKVRVGSYCVDGADVAVGHQAQLDEGLEAVADAQHQAVALLQQLAHRLGDGGAAEEGGDELGAAVRLVAAGEAAGQHDDLAASEWPSRRASQLSATSAGVRLLMTRISGLGPGPRKGTGGVVLAVGAGEDRDDAPWAWPRRTLGAGGGERFRLPSRLLPRRRSALR